jgi:nucleotide-binding universal stress UspA family protein
MELRSILIAYDGSPCADAALDDLRRAGLPARLDATILTVAETASAEPNGLAVDHGADDTETATLAPLTRRAGVEIHDAERVAAVAMQRLRATHRGWRVRTAVAAGSAADAIVRHIDEGAYDLVVLGSHGRTAIGRTVLGSVSQYVLAHSRVSVRIGRNQHAFDNAAVRIVLGYDGSQDAGVALRAIGARRWPRGSSVRVIGAISLSSATYPTDMVAFDDSIEEIFDEQHRHLRADVARALRRLRVAHIPATADVAVGRAAGVILETARSWGADLIVVGAQGHGLAERIILGSVSAALAARAACSVEVFRRESAS